MCSCGGTCRFCIGSVGTFKFGPRYRDGEGKAVFTRTDGKIVVVDNVRVDSIGPSAENNGVIGVEFFGSDRIIHIPFVEFWEIKY